MDYLKSFDGEKIAYQVHSNIKTSKRILVIVHGFGGDLNFFSSFIKFFKQKNCDATIVTYALRGHGYSSRKYPPNNEYLEQSHTQDLIELLKKFPEKKVILLGHSLGGIIIQDLINNHPIDNLNIEKGIFVCSTTNIFGLNVLRKLFYKLLVKKTFNINKTNFTSKNNNFYKSFSQSWDIDIKRFLHDTTVVGSIFDWFLIFAALHGWKNKQLNKIDKKNYYYIYGKKDIIVPSLFQKIKLRKLKNINLLAINTGHIAPITNPSLLADKIAEIIKK